jgi:Fe-S cluster assembly ATPase SufC
MFEFDIAKLKEYVEVMKVDGIAITNHNKFDRVQFTTIKNTLNITVLPGIEINLGKGHALLISDEDDLNDFASKCSRVSELIRNASDSIDVPKLREVFGDLSKYLVIPHYDKNPMVDKASLEALGNDFIAGEVASAKKFIYAQKDVNHPTPLLSSDARAKTDWDFKTRQTYLDISDICTRSIRLCLADKNKVSLSKEEGNELIQVTPGGVTISSGLTVVLGGRSSGKSRTLDEIKKYNEENENIKYIRQFELVEIDPEKESEKFNERVGKKQQEDGDKYLKQFRGVVDEVRNISLNNDDKKLSEYVGSLLKLASETERQDFYSKTAMFAETEFQIDTSDKLEALIKATTDLLNPGKYGEIVESKIARNSLIELLSELIVKYRQEALASKKREIANELVRAIKHSLGSLSAVAPISEVNLLELARNKIKVAKFKEIVKELQRPRTIAQKTVRRFTIEECSIAIRGAQDLKYISGRKVSFTDAFSHYHDPYEFLIAIMEIEEVDQTSYYRFFTKIEYSILNEYGVAVSGGERAEFRLINEIDGASKFDMLLIDEPESSFDNIFLSKDVNLMIKEIAKNTPVVIVTHNNTIGASIKPDYLIYTERKIVDGAPEYSIFSGLATDNELFSLDGRAVSNNEVTLKYLEAGEVEYKERGKIYEMLKD